MGRHSRGAADSSPPPPPEPPAKHPYAPRSTEDTGVWDHSTYRVVDVGLPADAPTAFPLGGSRTQAPGPNRAASRTADLAPGPNIAPARNPAPYGAGRRDADLPPGRNIAPARYGTARRDADLPPGPNIAPARSGEPAGGRTALRSVPEADTGFRPPEPSRHGATRADLAGMGELRYGATREPGARYGATRADLAEPRGFGADPAPSRRSDDPGRRTDDPTPGRRSDDPTPGRRSADAAPGRRTADAAPGRRSVDLAPSRRRADPAPSRRGADPAPSRRGAEPARALVESARGLVEPGRGLVEPRTDPDEPRFGATRADLAESVGSTALAPREAPEPDEVTDTGARRARSTFHLAPKADAEADAGAEEHDYHDEPSLLLQWGIFVAQTLTGAVAGLGVWLGFYRLWSTYPFYAAPSVGAAAILMLVLARTLRRRHGHDLDLMTAIVTIGVVTVLTVLPAAFTLQSMA